jgi:hypothetical protein
MPQLNRNPSGGGAAVDLRATKVANDPKKITKKITKDSRSKTPTTTQAPAKSAKKKTKGLWWSDLETNNLLDMIQYKKPSGSYMWDQVCEMYNSKQERDLRGLSAMPYRDVDSIRTKWKSLKSSKKPTGDPTCPPNVIRAKRIAREIENGSSVFEIGGETSSSSSDSENDDVKSSDDDGSAGSDSDGGRHASSICASPVQQRSAIVQESFIPTSPIFTERQRSAIVQESFIPTSPIFVAVSDDEDKEIPGSPSSQQIHDAQIIPTTQVSKTASAKAKHSAKNSVPVRLGMSAEQLQQVAAGLAGDKKKHKKHKAGVPENPSVTKKRTLSNELKEADQAYQESVENREAEKQRRHSEEMKRLDNQHKIEEMRYQAEAVKSNALLSAVLVGVSAFSSMMQNPQLAQAIQSLVPRGPVNSAPPPDGHNL